MEDEQEKEMVAFLSILASTAKRIQVGEPSQVGEECC